MLDNHFPRGQKKESTTKTDGWDGLERWGQPFVWAILTLLIENLLILFLFIYFKFLCVKGISLACVFVYHMHPVSKEAEDGKECPETGINRCL